MIDLYSKDPFTLISQTADIEPHTVYQNNHKLLSKKFRRLVNEYKFMVKHSDTFYQLTGREMQVLKLLAQGYNNPKVAKALFISRRTVEQHRKHINRKLKIKSFADILRYAQAFDLV